MAWSVLFVQAALSEGRDVPVPTSESFTQSWARVGFRHDIWERVLADHVSEDGLVDYAAIKSDTRFLEYLHRLANTDPAKIGDSRARLAFWINAYNALAIQGVLETLPTDERKWAHFSVLDVAVPGVKEKGKGFFVGLRFVVGGRRYTLDEIEKAVILRDPTRAMIGEASYAAVGPDRPDPRVHFALVCCAKGCPVLRREAYEAAKLDAQLDDAVRRFVRDESRARFDEDSRTMHVSKLLGWYGKDLTDPRMSPHAESVANFLSRYVSDSALARSLSQDAWTTLYTNYDWALNTKR